MVQINFPEINFWNRQAERITFINEGDFRREKLLARLNLDQSPLQNSFGVTDREEILKRQRILGFFMENPAMINFVRRNFTPTFLPTDNQGFIDYFFSKEARNPFWAMINDFLALAASSKNVPQEFLNLVNFLKETRNDLEAEERMMAEGIHADAKKATRLEGIIIIPLIRWAAETQVFNAVYAEYVYGYRLYSGSLTGLGKKMWNSSKFFTGIKAFSWADKACQKICKAHNRRVERRYYSPLIIRNINGTPILREVEKFVADRLRGSSLGEGVMGASLEVYFRYDENGLIIQFVGAKVTSAPIRSFPYTPIDPHFPGYRDKETKEIIVKNRSLRAGFEEAKFSLLGYNLIKVIENAFPEFGRDESIKVESPESDREFKWYSLVSLYQGPDFIETYERVSKYRNFFFGLMPELCNIADIAERLVAKSRSWEKSLSFPKILSDEEHGERYKVFGG